MKDDAGLSNVQQLVDAIYACDPADAAIVMGVILEERRVGMPLPAFVDDDDEAASWAVLATFEELRAYFIAAGRMLAEYPLGPKGQTRLAEIMLAELSPADRAKVIAGAQIGEVARAA